VFYVGFWCDEVGPFTRQSVYFEGREGAENALAPLLRILQVGCEGTAREPDPQTTSGAAGEGVAAYLRSVPREKTWTCPAEGCGLSWPIPEAYCTCGHQDQDDYESWRVVELTDKQDSFITNSGGLIQHKSYIATIDPEDSRTWALCWVRIPEENDSKP